MSISKATRKELEQHLTVRQYNSKWLQPCLASPEAFPYRVIEDGKATLASINRSALVAKRINPMGTKTKKPPILLIFL